MDEFADVIIHSSFLEDHGQGRDRRFGDRQQKLSHFGDCQAMFAEDQRYARLVLDICGSQLEQLAALGLMQSGPSWRLLPSHGPLVPATASAGDSLSRELYRRTVSFLLTHMARPGSVRVIVAGCDERSGADPLFAYLERSDAAADILCTAGQFEALASHFAGRGGVVLHENGLSADGEDVQRLASRVTELAGPGAMDVLQIADSVLAMDIAMRVDLVVSRPRLVLLPVIDPGSPDLARMRNVFANLGYAGVRIGTAFLAARRDTLDAALELELGQLDT